jgi:hypothetical protein
MMRYRRTFGHSGATIAPGSDTPWAIRARAWQHIIGWLIVRIYVNRGWISAAFIAACLAFVAIIKGYR